MNGTWGIGHKRDGVILIIAMIFLAVFVSLGAALTSLSDMNTQVAHNFQQAYRARYCAESGLEVMRYWLSQVQFSEDTDPNQRIEAIAASLQTVLSDNGITNVQMTSTDAQISVANVYLDAEQQDRFQAVLQENDGQTLPLYIYGMYGDTVQRTIRVDFGIGTSTSTIFDFGVASKGPLAMSGNVSLCGANDDSEADTYIESANDAIALTLTGNGGIAGDVQITNASALVDIQGGNATIGGESGQAAIDNHVDFGVPVTQFPLPDPKHFEPWAVNIVDSSTQTNGNRTFENIRIVAGTNPCFSGNITINGVVFIETPNVVEFHGNLFSTAIIAGDGDWTDDSGTNQVIFSGNISSNSVSTLPDQAQFAGLQEETGTFLIVPGFAASFGGNFHTLSGGIFANGIEFHGNAGGTVRGSVINYADETMVMSGNSDIEFDRSGTTQVPAGFSSNATLVYQKGTYSEPL